MGVRNGTVTADPEAELEDKSESSRAEAKRGPRLQVELSPEALEGLNELRKLSGARSNAEVVRNSIRLYRWYIERIQQEGHTLHIAKDNVLKEVEIVF